MPQREVQLRGGAYQARDLPVHAQRCVNLYAEIHPKGGQAPVPVTNYLTAGLLKRGDAPEARGFRCLFTASSGTLYGVVRSKVYQITSAGAFVELGTITDGTSPVSMADNGAVLMVVDGSADGWCVDLTTQAFAQVSATNFYGANWVEYIDTYFILNNPGTNQWYTSLSNVTKTELTDGTAFDPLDIVGKTGGPDDISAICSLHGELWIIGVFTSEVWQNTGNAEFAFERVPNALISHGCAAQHSLATTDIFGFMLMQDKEGKGVIIVKTSGYGFSRVSTHAIEQDIASYNTVSDAIGYCRQEEGHAYYVITFPSADKTWMMELASGQWCELSSFDANDVLGRHRAAWTASAYGKNWAGDFSNGKLYEFDRDHYLDDTKPIPRVRSFPHLLGIGNRVTYHHFIANMEVGQVLGTSEDDPPLVTLRWSDDRGETFGNGVTQSMGALGQYLTSPKWSRLGMARDRIFELSWSEPGHTALSGAFVMYEDHET